MFKKILIINFVAGGNRPLADLFNALGEKNYFFIYAKIFLGPKIDNKLKQPFFIIALPIFYLIYLPYLIYFRTAKGIRAVICLKENEKIIIAPLAKLLKLKIIWIEEADSLFLKKEKINGLLFLVYKLLYQPAVIVVFSAAVKYRLMANGLAEQNIKLIFPAVKLNQGRRQDNIFSELAKVEGKNFRKKFFTVGTIIRLDKKERLETLFRAVEICRPIIPNLQLVIVGDGEEKKNFVWLAKKIGLDHITWFVGEQAQVIKWLESFDIFAAVNEIFRLPDFDIVFKAMASGIPALGPRNLGLEEILPKMDNETFGLFGDNDSETLARRIIKLWRDKQLRKKLGTLEKEAVEKHFLLEHQAEEFEKIL
jgi:glycosyltransferase involved in cell wall biosynthesis